MKLPDWAGDYVGIPYATGGRTRASCDCWGLFALIQREVFNFDIADYEGPDFHNYKDAKAIGEAARAFADRFSKIPAGQERAGDAVLMRLFGQPLHIGVVVVPGAMLHAEDKCDSIIEEYRGMKWERRIIAFHRAQPL